jgi:hypothetical protein
MDSGTLLPYAQENNINAKALTPTWKPIYLCDGGCALSINVVSAPRDNQKKLRLLSDSFITELCSIPFSHPSRTISLNISNATFSKT